MAGPAPTARCGALQARVALATVVLMLPLFKFDAPGSHRNYAQALAIARYGSPDVTPFAPDYDFVRIGDRTLAAVAPGLSFLQAGLAWPVERLAAGGLVPVPSYRAYQVVFWLLLTLPVTAVATAAVVGIARRHGATDRQAVFAALAVFFGTPLATSSYALRQTPFLVAATLGAVHLLGRPVRAGTEVRVGLLVGGVGAFAALVDLQGAFVAAGTVVALGVARRWRAAAAAAGCAAVALAVQLGFNAWSTGDPLTFATLEWARQSTAPQPSLPAKLLEIVVDPRSSVFLWVPALAFVPWSSLRPSRLRRLREPGVLVATLLGGHLVTHLLLDRRNIDAALGPRYALLWVVPLLAVVGFHRSRPRIAAAVVGLVVNVSAALVTPNAIGIPVTDGLPLLLRHGPWVDWTTLVIPAGPLVPGTGVARLLPTPTPLAAAVSTAVLLLAAAAAWLVLTRRRSDAAAYPPGVRAPLTLDG